MSKTNIKDINWTPVIDSIVDKYGAVTALIFGVIWRYCQMKDGECRASQSTIAKRCGYSRQTAITHIKILVENGYITEKRTDTMGVNVYKDTGKAGIRVEVKAFDELVNDIDKPCKSNLQPLSNKLTTHVNLIDTSNSIEDSVKDTNKDTCETKILTPQQETVGFIAELTGIDLNIKGNGARIGKEASKLLAAGYDLEKLKQFKAWWWGVCWKGKDKQQPPELYDISRYIGQSSEKLGLKVNNDGTVNL